MPSLSSTLSLAALCAWQRRHSWRILTTDFGHGESFLAVWKAWKADAQRSRQLHFTAICAAPVSAAQVHAAALPQMAELAQTLGQQMLGLLPGIHRLSFEQGRVLLTLWVGDAHTLLRQQNSSADAMLLHLPFASDNHSIKALARHCHRGSVLQVAPSMQDDAPLRHALTTAGFVFDHEDNNCAHFAPRWEPRKRPGERPPIAQPGTAVVIGAGLAGASVAYSLAIRGWRVTVLAKGEAPADGASGLPAGLFCPHVSPDDSVLSRLSRNGVRMTLQRLRDVCREGLDWGHSGVLEHCTDGGTGLPTAWASGPGAQWSHACDADQLADAGLPADTAACWHAQAGWVRPAQLVKAQLAQPGITFVGQAHVARLVPDPEDGWQALDACGTVLARADLALVACGPATTGLLPDGVHWHLQALRGQISWGWHSTDNAAALPPFPVNGNGNLVTQVPLEQGKAWVMGSTFERDVAQMPISTTDQAAAHAVNFGKLSTLLPGSAPALAPWFTPGDAHCQPTWGEVRCASHDRLPIAGPISATTPGLWALTAMGARGLTLSVLCGELIAAQLHGDPLPLDAKLAQHLGTERLSRQMPRSHP